MSPSKLLLLLLVVTLIVNVESWRRRHRRRRRAPSCSPRHCVTSWNAWSQCNCLGKRSRTSRIISHPTCGRNACPATITQTGSCNTGTCVNNGGYCNVATAKCVCKPGRTGTRCEKTCPAGKYGKNCQSKCNCVAGVGCDPVKGYCKCPIGRSGTKCQYRYRCSSRYRCYSLKPTLMQYNRCFFQQHVTSISRYAYTVCPSPTHYTHRCFCYNNCLPAYIYKSRVCLCKCRAKRSSKVPVYYRGKYVTNAICCPRYPYA